MARTLQNPLSQCHIEVKKTGDGAAVFEGYASVFGGVDSYGDTIEKGAYADTIKNRRYPPLMLYQHWSDNVIGKWLSMSEDDTGLKVRGEFTPGHSLAQDVYASMKHEAITGLSIGYRVPKGGALEGDDGTRVLKKIELIEVSVVARPADDNARISMVKSEIDEIQSIADFEVFLREAGRLSKSTSGHLVHKFKELLRCETAKHYEGELASLKNRLALKNALSDLHQSIKSL